MIAARSVLTRLAQVVAFALLALAAAAFWRGDGGTAFMPHAHCFLFNRPLMLLHGLSDLFIGLAYVSISGTLVYLVVRARQEIPFHWMMLAFAVFIVACGATHFMEVWTLRAASPRYWLSGGVKLVTAVASVVTALLLPPLIPKILELLGAARTSAERKRQLETAYTELGNLYEQVKQLDTLKTSFFANVSHELRTPLALIFGPIDRLMNAPELLPEARRDLRLARRNAAQLYKHVTDLLDVARLDAGKMELHYSHVDLAAVLRRTGASFESIASERILQLKLDAPAHLHAAADEEKIERVMVNLLSNALKFVPEGGFIQVTLSEEEGSAVLLVEDSGPGIPAQYRQAVFERFQQGDEEMQRRYGGSGLGLAIVREFVELHHGSVTVHESAAGGASFRVELPMLAPRGVRVAESGSGQNVLRPRDLPPETTKAESNRAAAQQEASGDGAAAAGRERPSVLIVEDNPDMSEFIARVLGAEYRVTTASNGRDGLAVAQANPPDLILSDMMMPGMTGEELLGAVRADPVLAATPLIFLTARADEELRLWALDGGAQDYVMKPFAVEELRVRVRNQVTAKLTRDTLQRSLDSQTRDLAELAQEVSSRAEELARARKVAEDANHAKDQFLAVLSHELRTPLTPALAAAEHLETAEVDAAELRESVRMIRRNIELEARLVDDLLDLTRITRGKLELHLASVDVHGLLTHAQAMAQEAVEKKHLEMRLEAAALQHHVRGDGGRLLQIFWNLLLNAAKFTPDGGAIRLSTSNPAPNRLRIEVADSGVGIEPAELTRIFEPFQQGQEGTVRRSGGLGLGLTVARALVIAHGGTISAESAGPGQGSTFTIELETAESAPAAPPAEPTAGGQPRGLRILLVEDHEDTRAVLARQLRRWGHAVEIAGSVAEARVQAGTGAFDVLISDIGLPDGTGHEVLAAVRERQPVAAIAMSGFGMEGDLQLSEAAGFREHLVKPLRLEQLREALQRIFPTPAQPSASSTPPTESSSPND